jgi:transcriptional regulator with XRE-family HTH domain
MDDLSFGQWVQRERRSRRLTQAELGDLVGCSTAAIRKIEADERRPSREVAAGLALALGIGEAQHSAVVAFARGPDGQTGARHGPGVAHRPQVPDGDAAESAIW